VTARIFSYVDLEARVRRDHPLRAARGIVNAADTGPRPKVPRDEFGVLTMPLARAFDLDDNGMMEQSVEERGGDDGIAEDVTPFGEAAIGGEDHGALLVAGVDELEEEIAPAGNDRQVADLVDDQECRPAEVP